MEQAEIIDMFGTYQRLSPKMKHVVRTEVLKLLAAGIIYPIADSKWVSPVHYVPKKEV